MSAPPLQPRPLPDQPAAQAGGAEWRRAKRRELIEARNALTAEEHLRRSHRILEHVEALLRTVGCTRGTLVGFYWPIRQEVDLCPLIEKLAAQGGVAALPVISGKAQPLEFRRWRTGDPLASGAYSVPEPLESPALQPDVLLIPLVGFDAACFRLGYGGGFYDRTLRAFQRKPLAIGVGFELARLATIQPRPFDVAMNAIVTEAGLTQPT